MKLKTLFILNAVVSVPFWIGSAVAPSLFLALLVAYAVALVVSVLGQLRGVLNVLGWFLLGGR